MRKSFITLAVTAALVISNITPAFAAYIVAPPETEGATYERYVWSVEEEQRQKDRLVNTYAENIKATTPENSVERLNAVVKAVADYCPVLASERYLGVISQWEKETYTYTTYQSYVRYLSQAVGMDAVQYGAYTADGHNGHGLNSCAINGTVYYVDAYRFVESAGAEGLASVSTGAWYATDEQIAELTRQDLENAAYKPGETFTCNNGVVITVE